MQPIHTPSKLLSVVLLTGVLCLSFVTDAKADYVPPGGPPPLGGTSTSGVTCTHGLDLSDRTP
jgi:hypothetical protein